MTAWFTLHVFEILVSLHIYCFFLPFHRIQAAFAVISALMTISAFLQISLVSKREWNCLFGHVGQLVPKRFSSSLSFSTADLEEVRRQKTRPTFHRQFSFPASLHSSPQTTTDFLSELRKSSPSDDPDHDAPDSPNNKLKFE